jgi:F-type H+-transporting ATPase subunit alpha
MQIKPEEVGAIIKQRIASFETELKMESVGTVLQVGDGIARVYGLQRAMSSELVEFPGGVFGMALNLDEDSVGCIILGDDRGIKEGDTVRCTGRIVEVPVGNALVGRVVNALGQPLDGNGPVPAKTFRPIEGQVVDAMGGGKGLEVTVEGKKFRRFGTPNVVQRQPVKEPLQTGIKAIDAMIPIGRGQRELILGDRQTGKTAIILDTILNQKDSGVICIYVAIGQKASTVAQVIDVLNKYDAMKYTIVVSASASDPAALQFIAPFAGCAMGEEFRDTGRHAVVFYDDLTKHAWAYRQLSLLLRRPPGREAYPGDIFNLHSRLLERAAKLSDDFGAGSLTALPVIETQAGDVSAYIPTNVISITDGQIYLEPDLFYAGVRPAVNVGISVSRVGGNAQVAGMRKVAGRLRMELAQYRELAAFAQFASDLDKATRDQLTRGERLVELLKQPQFVPMPVEEQIVALFVGSAGFLDDLSIGDVKRFEAELFKFVHEKYPTVPQTIRMTKKLEDKTAEELKKAAMEFKQTFSKTV